MAVTADRPRRGADPLESIVARLRHDGYEIDGATEVELRRQAMAALLDQARRANETERSEAA